MPSKWQASAVLKGLNGRTVPVRWDLGEFTGADFGAEALAAQSAMNQLVGSLDDVTNAPVIGTRLTQVDDSGAGFPGDGDLFKAAMVNVYTLDEDDPTAVEHISQVYIPAPVDGIFVAASGPLLDVVDITDADLTQYIQQVAQHAFISDGETIQTASGDDGMIDGRRVIRKVRLGR